VDWFVDPSRGEWLRRRIAELDTSGPSGFPAYIRILHPVDAWRPLVVSESVVTELETETWSWAHLAALNGASLSASSEWWDISGQTDSVDGWTFAKPHDGWVDPHTLASLVPALRAHTTTPADVTVALWEGWGFGASGSPAVLRNDSVELDAAVVEGDPFVDAKLALMAASDRSMPERKEPAESIGFPLPRLELPDRRYVLGASSLTELEDPSWPFRAGLGWRPGDLDGPTPQLIWPADHAWCVSTEIDAPYTVVAASEPLAAVLLDRPDLETQRVPPPSGAPM